MILIKMSMRKTLSTKMKINIRTRIRKRMIMIT